MKHRKETTFEQTYNLCVVICIFTGYDQNLWRKSDFFLFCIFKIVTYINCHILLLPLLVNFGLPGENLITSTL